MCVSTSPTVKLSPYLMVNLVSESQRVHPLIKVILYGPNFHEKNIMISDVKILMLFLTPIDK